MLGDDQLAIKDFSNGKISKEKWTQGVSERMREVANIMASHGIARKDLHGQAAYKAMIALILHSGDLELMRKYLNNHEELSGVSVDISDRATITDKMCVISNKPQVYGTQYKIVNNAVVFGPIEDVSTVNLRRASLGLVPIEKFKQDLEMQLTK